MSNSIECGKDDMADIFSSFKMKYKKFDQSESEVMTIQMKDKSFSIK